MSDSRRCRLCDYSGVEAVIELPGMPRWNHRLLRLDELSTDSGVDLTIYRCPSCGFVSVPMNLSDDYYDDYVNAPSLSLQAQQFQTQQARDFVNRFGLSGRRVLEIGCGDGYFLRAMHDAGAECVGIEPSSSQPHFVSQRGLQIEFGILSGRRILVGAPFDAFVARQVLEHVEDMRDFLLTIRDNLRAGAVGLVEVPNLDKLIDEARFFDFIPEHVNYFTPRSLALAVQLSGFEVLEVATVQEGESLRALVKWQSPTDYEPVVSRIESLRFDIATFVSDCQSQGKKVAFWGAGGKGLSMMAIADVSGVRLLVDSDPAKVGLYTPVSHLCVASPEELALQGVDAVIVVAPAYENEIVTKLRTELAFSGQIALAGRDFRLVNC